MERNREISKCISNELRTQLARSLSSCHCKKVMRSTLRMRWYLSGTPSFQHARPISDDFFEFFSMGYGHFLPSILPIPGTAPVTPLSGNVCFRTSGRTSAPGPQFGYDIEKVSLGQVAIQKLAPFKRDFCEN